MTRKLTYSCMKRNRILSTNILTFERNKNSSIFPRFMYRSYVYKEEYKLGRMVKTYQTYSVNFC